MNPSRQAQIVQGIRVRNIGIQRLLYFFELFLWGYTCVFDLELIEFALRKKNRESGTLAADLYTPQFLSLGDNTLYSMRPEIMRSGTLTTHQTSGIWHRDSMRVPNPGM